MASEFTPSRAPSIGLVKTTAPRVASVTFGDGYSQDVADGINTALATATASWQSVSHAEADSLDAFFAGLGGVGRFTYRIPGEAADRLWKCPSWTRTWLAGGRSSFVAQWQEVVL